MSFHCPPKAESLHVSSVTSEVVQEERVGDEIDLRRILDALARRRRLAFTVLFGSLLVGAALTGYQRVVSPTYQGSFRLLVSDPINQPDSGVEGGSSALQSLALPERGDTNTTTLIEVLTSPSILEPVERKLGLPLRSLAGRVTIGVPTTRGVVGSSGVLKVSLEWQDPAEGVQILNLLSKEFLSYSLRQRQEKLTQGLAFLDQQAPELQQRVNDLQNRLSAFRRATGYVEPEQKAAANMGQRQALETKLETLEQEQARLSGRLASVRRGDLGPVAAAGVIADQGPAPMLGPVGPKGADPSSATPQPASAAAVESMRPAVTPLEELYAVESALAEAQANFTDASPQVRELKAKRDRLRPVLQRRLQAEIRAALSQNQSQQEEINRQMGALNRTFQTTPDQIKKYDALQQQLDVARSNLSSYIGARENFRLQVAQRTVPWSLLSSPQFGARPVKPNLGRNLLLSLLLGSLGGVAAALMRDRVDPVFHDSTEAAAALPLPLLGAVPYLPLLLGGSLQPALEQISSAQRFTLKESLSNLFTNFRLLRADKTLRLVALTSTIHSEGKSTCSALFAKTLAQLGQRVLLVDADMRIPTAHRILGCVNSDGLSSLLTDPTLKAEDLVQKLQPGLDILTAGPNPPDTTQLLSSKRCGVVLENIRAMSCYDLVIFDTPPALMLGDSVLIAEHMDGILLVLGIGRVNRELPAQVIQRMRDAGVDVLGMLANHVMAAARQDRGIYGYGYSYHTYGELAERYRTGLESGDEDTEAGGKGFRGFRGQRMIRRAIVRVLSWVDKRQ